MDIQITNDTHTMGLLISKNASEQEKYALSEITYYLERMTGKVFSHVEDTSSKVIAIGRVCEEKFGVAYNGSVEGFRIKTVDNNICITGGKRGVIYGMYALLEKLGCRFFTATCEKIPTLQTVSIQEMDETQEPDFEYREHNYYELGKYTRFAVKRRMNGRFHPIQEKHGGHIEYSWFVHSFEKIISPEIYGKEHPEYFSMLENGERCLTPHKNQLCLTNPEVLQIAIQSVRQNLLDNPHANIVSISQNDYKNDCQCAHCKKINEEEGSPSGTLLRFVNSIAESLEKEFPHVLFDTLAYQYTRKAPNITKPRHNVCVRLCSIECCFAHPFETCDDTQRGAFVQDLKDWHKTGGKIYIWDYTTCFNFYPTPHPNWFCLQPNMQLFKENGVCGVFEQANTSEHGGVDLNELRAYIISKLLWNVHEDVEALITEFTDFYYGAGGQYIKEYIKTFCDISKKHNCHVGFNDQPIHKYLDTEYLDVYDALFQKALEATQKDYLCAYRVAKAYLSIRYVRMMQNIIHKKPYDRETINQFISDWKGFGLTRTEEWTSIQTSQKAWLRGQPVGALLYDYWGEEGQREEL